MTPLFALPRTRICRRCSSPSIKSMSDPFSLATGVTGLLSLTMELSKLISAYSCEVAGASDEVHELVIELATLETTLTQLVNLLRGHQTELIGVVFEPTSALCMVINLLKERLRILFEQLDKVGTKDKSRRLIRILKWPFQRKECLETIKALHRCSQTLEFSLEISNW